MKELSRLSKLFMFLALLSGVLWIGAYLTRLFITYQLFVPEDLSLKTYITSENIGGVFSTILPAITTTFVLYIVFILGYILFLVSSKISLKKNGWLFIVTLIIFITMPFEVYLMTIDYKLLSLLNTGEFDNSLVLSLFLNRIKVLGSFPLVEIFCYFSVIYFILFQPLTAKEPAGAGTV
ncbi:MAG: hypothetical protein R6W90_12860 [Ignavibacteriaceae bacterium]